eukprot:15466774-Alexandrium_andersonii.AAC.1
MQVSPRTRAALGRRVVLRGVMSSDSSAGLSGVADSGKDCGVVARHAISEVGWVRCVGECGVAPSMFL